MRHLIILLLSLFLAACSSNSVVDESTQNPSGSTSEGSSETRKFTYKTPDGSPVLVIKSNTSGEKYTLKDPNDQLLATLKVKGDRVKVKDAQDKEIYKIKKKDDGLEVEDGAENRLYRIKPREDGGWKVEDAKGTLLVKIKLKEDGLEARDAQDETICKAKGREDKVNFKSEDGTELHRLTGVENPLVAVWLGLETFDAPLRAGLVVYFQEVH
jgi:hypothetical protein